MTDVQTQSLLFVCLGNICRSPLAECLFRHHATQRGVADRFVLDSAGTGGWHAGHPPDERMQRVGLRHGVEVTGAARQVRADDFERFDLILCMDGENHADLLESGADRTRLRLLLSCDPDAEVRDVPDPYYGGEDGFERVFALVDRACAALLESRLGPDAAAP